MITGRRVILAAIVVFVLAMILNVIVLLQPLDNDGLGRDSYGVYPSGHRAVLEVMTALDLPAKRTHAPFDSRIGRQVTYALIGPDVGLLNAEEAAIRRMKQWVESGGRLVIGFVDGWASSKWLDAFDLEEVQFVSFESGEPLYDRSGTDSEADIPPAIRKAMEDRRQRQEARRERTFGEDIEEIITARPPELQHYRVAECTGSFQEACRSVQTLALRKGGNVAIDSGSSNPNSILTITNSHEAQVLIAEFERGDGSIILVGDISVFDNLSLREGDNSVLLVKLLSEGRESIVFDEFFHGLSIRGNPVWVFTQPGYRAIAILLLATVVLFLWHECPQFGNLPPPEAARRRTLEAYLNAVSRLMLRTRTHTQRLLLESRDAFLWRMARRLRLAGERNQIEAIRNRLSRIDPEKREEFDRILAQYEYFDHHGCSSKELLSLLKRSQRCLS